MSRAVSLLLILTLAVLHVWPQQPVKGPSSFEPVDPFKIKPGSSFSASVPRGTQHVNGENVGSKRGGTVQISRDYAEALEIVRRHHVNGQSVNYADLNKSALDSMLHVLDPHSNFFDASEYQEMLTDQQSEYFGIGATIANYSRGESVDTFVISTFPDSPAARAGLRFGDRILSVNGESMAGRDSAYVRDKVRGKRGTNARVVVERSGSRRSETIDLRRNRVPQPSIPDAYILRDGIGYIDMSEGFNYTTADELGVVMNELHKQGMKSLVLDLRDNTGGILDQAIKVAEKFLPLGSVVVTQRGRFAVDNRVWKSANPAPESLPLVILVNDSTASASEIVAGAMQDYDRGLIVGENSFGKGLVQSIINLPHGAGLTLTTARYFTPSGRSIQRDYSATTLYDYFNHKMSPASQPKGAEARTVTGRKVYGGDGITPDEIVKSEELSATETKLTDAMFFFSSELASGAVAGFEHYRVVGPTKYGQRIRPVDYPVTGDIIAEFRQFLRRSEEWKSLADFDASAERAIKLRIRYHLTTAAFGVVAARQVLIEEDRQVARAVESLPRAEQLARLASRVKRR